MVCALGHRHGGSWKNSSRARAGVGPITHFDTRTSIARSPEIKTSIFQWIRKRTEKMGPSSRWPWRRRLCCNMSGGKPETLTWMKWASTFLPHRRVYIIEREHIKLMQGGWPHLPFFILPRSSILLPATSHRTARRADSATATACSASAMPLAISSNHRTRCRGEMMICGGPNDDTPMAWAIRLHEALRRRMTIRLAQRRGCRPGWICCGEGAGF